MSEYFNIKGGKTLQGEITIAGAKNHALKMIPAALLSEESCTLTNVPDISDVRLMGEIIESIGGRVNFENNSMKIEAPTITTGNLPVDLVPKMRTSFLFIVPLLHRFGKVSFPHPGGDAIGRRPIDMTLDFLRDMGASIHERPNSYEIEGGQLKGIDYTFKWVTHTGTEALMMAAVLAEGTTVIKNSAMEPEVQALADYLNSVGAKISGAGTPTITIEGVEKLRGGECKIIPDRIEAGTMAILGALCGNPLTVKNIRVDHLDTLWKYFDLLGVAYNLTADSITVYKSHSFPAQHIKTHEYPGFITDLQPPMTLLLTQASGLSMVHETIYEGRLFFVDKINSMGADIIMADPHRVLVQGPKRLYGKKISSPDIRAGITLVMAALIAEGESQIFGIHHIDRGYQNLESRLKAIGADIERKTGN